MGLANSPYNIFIFLKSFLSLILKIINGNLMFRLNFRVKLQKCLLQLLCICMVFYLGQVVIYVLKKHFFYFGDGQNGKMFFQLANYTQALFSNLYVFDSRCYISVNAFHQAPRCCCFFTTEDYISKLFSKVQLREGFYIYTVLFLTHFY